MLSGEQILANSWYRRNSATLGRDVDRGYVSSRGKPVWLARKRNAKNRAGYLMKGEMDNPSVSGSEWTLTEESFTKFLAHLDRDRDRAGEKYEALRLTLVKFFDWRGAHFPEECADETFNRIARKIDSGEVIRDVATYCRGVARMILLESLRQPERKNIALDEVTSVVAPSPELDETDAKRDCFERCLNDLPAENRRLILEYYRDESRRKIENRRLLAEKLGIPLNAVRSRAQRVRSKLENCVNRCAKRRL